VKDASARLRTATRRAKSDVANKLVSMFLHEFSRRVSQEWPLKVDAFQNRCPYCRRSLSDADWAVEHLDGMNRCRAGLHVAGNVLVACRRCNSEKRRDDSKLTLTLAATGWESFLSHDGTRCPPSCQTCLYWKSIWPNEEERQRNMAENLQRIRLFRAQFIEFQAIIPSLVKTMPHALAKLYSDCQYFAEEEIKKLLQEFEEGRSRAS